jgi:S-DNA-T family DNA segregation ATPase FtsK/SpoIIIE
LVVDPLTEPLEWTETDLAGDVATWVAGIDQDGQPVTIRTADVSGIVVAGLAGYGKTVFLNARFCALADSEAVQFVLIDGKGGSDYDDLFARAWLSAKDEPEKVRDQSGDGARVDEGPAGHHPRHVGGEERVACRAVTVLAARARGDG